MRYRNYSLTPLWVIMALNFLLFLAVIISPILIGILGLMPAAFPTHPWTIVTSMFVHSGFWHIFANMVTLYFFGTFLFRLVGRNGFLTVYFGGGLLGNALFILSALILGTDYFTIAIGASGAIYAVAGALVVMMPKLPVRLYFIIPMPLWVVVLVFFVLFSFLPGVAWQAHLGGLVFGLIAGYFFRRKRLYLF